MRLNRTIIAIIAIVLLLGAVVTVAAVVALVLNYQAVWNWYLSSNDASKRVLCSESTVCSVVHPIVYGLIFILVYITGFAYTTLLERRILAVIQQRVGPNRVGFKGFMQPAADAVKLIFHEYVLPDTA